MTAFYVKPTKLILMDFPSPWQAVLILPTSQFPVKYWSIVCTVYVYSFHQHWQPGSRFHASNFLLFSPLSVIIAWRSMFTNHRYVSTHGYECLIGVTVAIGMIIPFLFSKQLQFHKLLWAACLYVHFISGEPVINQALLSLIKKMKLIELHIDRHHIILLLSACG